MARKRLVNFYKSGPRNYEVAVILHQKLSSDDLKSRVEALKEIALSFGAVSNHVAVTQLKSYSYAIKSTNNKKGYYACFYLTMKADDVAELQRKFALQDDVLRVLVVLANPKKNSLGVFAPNYDDDSHKARKRFVSYDDPNSLIKFMGERGRIEARKQALGRNIASGVALRQRVLSREIKRSRFLSLLPYVEE